MPAAQVVPPRLTCAAINGYNTAYMNKERFDFICSVGSSCLCASSLRDAGLRLSSGPFDWLLGPTLVERAKLIANDFAGWFEPGDFEFLGNPHDYTMGNYLNRKTGYKFSHDFKKELPFEESFPEVRSKYERRVARLFERVRASRRVLFVWIENPVNNDRPSDEEVVTARRMLADKFPGVDVELLVIDRAPDDAIGGKIVRGDGYWRTTCPYRRKATESGKDVRPWDVDTRPIQALLSCFETADYRSASERRRHNADSRAAKYAELGVKSAAGYAIARLQVKICKHILNKLRRRGVDIRSIFDVQIRGGR